MACKTCGKAAKGQAALGKRVASPDGEGVTASGVMPKFGVKRDGQVIEHGSYIEAHRDMRANGGQLVTIGTP